MSAAVKILAAVLLAGVSVVLVVVSIAALTPKKQDSGRTGIRPATPSGPSVGYGNPGEPCATNRLGESFDFNGVTYVCSGPKPYRWRAQEGKQ